MSYHYEDIYYCYNTSHLVDTSQYSFSTPAHYDNSVLDSVEHARELEAYAEAAVNRTYSWDEIHPAYRNHLPNSYYEPMQPLVNDDEYYEDVTDEELAEMNRRCMEYQKQMTERKVEDVNVAGTVEAEKEVYPEEVGVEVEVNDEDHPQPIPPFHWTSLTVISLPDTPTCKLHPPSPAVPDILTPNPHLPSPNIRHISNHPHPHFQCDHDSLDICTSNPHPPDILTPLPRPLKPNIRHSSLFLDVRGWTSLGGR